MAVEVYRAAETWNTGGWVWWSTGCFWYFAQAISGSSSWRIIDSYMAAATPGAGRYKGDPIADGEWASNDASDPSHNDWIVVEQINPRTGFPRMQFKMQCCGSAAYADASGSGAGYKWEGTGNFRAFTIRFSPIGGWDLEDTNPDFATPAKASDNRGIGWYHFGSGNDGRWFWVMDDDYILGLGWNIVTQVWMHVAFWIGDYNPKAAEQDTIAQPARAIVSDDALTVVNPEGVLAGSFCIEQASSGMPCGCLDENGVWQDWPYSCGPMEDFLPGGTQTNEFDDTLGIDLMEIPIRLHAGGTPSGPDHRLMGSLRHVFRGYGIGMGARFDSKGFMCCALDYGLITEWDGSTNI
jgi:hypothetical protein